MGAHLRDLIAAHGGWIGFDTFMAQALYAPGLGYYANDLPKFGRLPGSASNTSGLDNPTRLASDFVTAPELSPLFGQALARQVAQALLATGTREVWEFGAGSGALALQLLAALDGLAPNGVQRYTIVDLSGTLAQRQAQRLHPHRDKVRWVHELPAQMQGVVVGNEVLDAMPVRLLARQQGIWHERGVATDADGAFVWQDRATDARPPPDIGGDQPYLTEIHPQAEAFIRTVGERLQRGAAFFLDYGFPEAEYYHPQRHMGTLMCHRAHQADANPLVDVGLKDITAHVNFTGIAVAAQTVGLELLGYTAQSHFLLNCGIAEAMQAAPLAERSMANKLLMEHEMGELFKVIGLVKGTPFEALGFAHGDRTHRL